MKNVVITAGKGKCSQKGVLCQRGKKSITLIENNIVIKIPSNSITAIRKQAGRDSLDED
ncbi:hypothetical protein [Selenihalanaerobacter shriftii]|uniref:hypothetical protein n=1 Tax=Selenihalanaerobacter shriftii TaxID=142842 RepID=UPI0013567061|nr:hypothetical protein [Selenihalanaerobacter shriftii]